GKKLDRATPSIYNAAFNSVQMWDGRKSSLEDQATGPMDSPNEMAADYDAMFTFLKGTPGYASAFAKAYPGEPIDKVTLSKAIASFERTIVSNNSRFDRWLRGEPNQLTAREVHGFRVFLDPDKGNCATCHKAPNFTDNGFHNIGLYSYGVDTPDVGRFAIKPVKLMNGAFKTPSLRNAGRESHYFHDGSVSTLEEVVDHYVRGGDIKTNLSPNIKPLNLSDDEKRDLVAFLHSLDNEATPVTFPELP
ncbi:MAG: cytochrome c peroxidase, partial [Burkholderiaceae bacterium]